MLWTEKTHCISFIIHYKRPVSHSTSVNQITRYSVKTVRFIISPAYRWVGVNDIIQMYYKPDILPDNIDKWFGNLACQT